MRAVWAQRQEALLSDGVVAPPVFAAMGDRLCACAAPYQQCLQTEAAQRHMQLDRAGLLSHLDRTNAEEIAAWVEVDRLVSQACLGTAPWAPRPLSPVVGGQVAERLGNPAGVIAFALSSFPKRGPRASGVKRPWGSHRGKVDPGQGG
jgi:hypothetical protein